ncbi:BapA/Bap/LapF family large adhesin [Leclercia sp. UBA2479]|uniref:BapA/Bap/LapF family large adhesin n=1 Tax=Leclercia sp. UBA2479 TaxID=1946738 RepID=UPI00257F24B6|nr:BapA/Bap/LapF family large adhesin [Leclercia sp. UBA2479]
MSKITVLSTLTKSETTMEGTQVILNDPSIVTLHVGRADIAGYSRSNDDLIVRLTSGETITLKNFYAAGNGSQLVLEETDGALWWIEDPLAAEQYESIASTEALLAGGATGSAGEGAVWPWVLGGLAVAGGIAIAASGGGGGGGGDDDNNNPLPPNPGDPDTTAPNAPTNLQLSTDGTTVTGSAEPGSTVTIRDANGNIIGRGQAGSDGKFSIGLDGPVNAGDTLTATATDSAGNVSKETQLAVTDTVAPEAPTNLQLSTDGTTITGSAEPGSTVTIRDANGNIIGKGQAGSDGKFTIDLGAPVNAGETLTATATDSAGNVSKETQLGVTDTVAPDAPTIVLVNDDVGSIKGPLTSGQSTDDTRPTFSGQGEAGATITLFDNGKQIGTTKVSADGSWSFTPGSNLSEGIHNITVKATDAAGNTSPASAGFTVIVDITPPAAPTAAIVNDQSGSVVGVVQNGQSTDENQPVLTGTGVPGSKLTIYDNNVVVGNVTVLQNGTWSFKPTAPLNEGSHTITVRESDAAGNLSQPSTPITFIVDTTPPEAPTLDPMAPEGIFVTGKAEANSTVFIYSGTTLLGQATAGADGTFSVRLNSAQTDGQQLNVVVQDTAGNRSTPVNFDATDSGFPDSPLIVRVENNNGADPVAIGNGQPTNDTTPLISGTAAANATINLLINGTAYGPITANGNGEWSFSPPALPDADYVITATATTPAGTSGPSLTWNFTIDTAPPTAPDDVEVSGNGTQVTGTAEAGSTVTVKDADGDTIGTATAGPDGRFTVTISPAQVNGEAITVTATDVAGNPSTVTNANAPDITAPGIPQNVVVAPDGASISGDAEPNSTVIVRDQDDNVVGQGQANNDGKFELTLDPPQTNGQLLDVTASDGNDNTSVPAQVDAPDSTPPAAPGDLAVSPDGTTVTGTTEPGSTVTVKDGDTTIGTGKADDSGNFSVTITPPQRNGESLDVSATDPSGNPGPAASVNAPDTTAPEAPVILSVNDNVEANTGNLDNGATTNDNTPLISGTGEPGSTITLLNNGVFLATVTVLENGSWSYTPAALTEGGHLFTATSKDAAGNVSGISNSWSITVDTALPDAPTIGTIIDNVEGGAGTVTSGQPTNDGTPTINGTGEPGATISIRLDGEEFASVTVLPNGTWTWTPTTPIPDGDYTLTTVATDAAGNVSEASPDFTLSIDTREPGQPTIGTITDNVGPNTGPIANGAATDDTTPTLTGTTDPGTTVTIYDGDNPIGTATVQPNGDWSFTPQVPLTEGPHTLTVVATNPAGTATTSTPVNLVIDTTAPETPAAPAVTANPDGTTPTDLSSGSTTRDTTPTLSGSGTEGDIITIYNGDEVLDTVTIPAGGVWTWTPTEPLDDGTYDLTLTVTAQDGAGNSSAPSQAVSITIDTDPPAVPDVPVVTDNVAQGTGPVADNGSTNDPRPVLSGTGVANDVITIYDSASANPGKVVGTVTVDANGNWSWRPEGNLTEGDHTFTTTATDPAGNESIASGGITVTVDISAPEIPVITTVGGAGNGGATDDTTPAIAGTLENADGDATEVIIYNNGVEIGRAPIIDGAWTFTPTTALPDGPLNLTAAAVDAAGNLSATSPVVTVTIDTLAPSVPQIDAVEGATLVGDILYSRDSTPTITGTGEPGSRITVTIDGTALESSPTVQPDGTWSITLPGNLALSDAAHTIEIVATDPAGNTTSGEPISLTVDTTPPGAPTVTALAPEGTPLTGTAEAGSTVVITGPGNVELGRGVADAQGNFSIALSPAQTSATTLTLIATDAAGNPGASTDYTVTDSDVDLPDVPVITTIIDGEGAVTGDVKGKTSDDSTPTLNGTAPANSTVNIFLDGNPVAVATVTAGPDGTWTWPVAPALTEGAHSFAVSATQDGVTSGLSPAASVTIDLTAPNAPVIGAVTDDVAPGTGPLTSGQTTNDAQPTLSGRGTPGETITVYDNDTPIGTALVGATGSWTFTPTEALGEGNHSLTITATDPAGNESDPSAAFTLVVDTVSLTPTITNVSDNVDPVQGTIPTNGVTNDNTPTLTGTAEPNSVVTISDGNTVLGTAIANASGTWTFTPTLAEGTHNFTVIATDPQGNVSDASTPWTVVVDTTAPTLPVITSVSDNVEGGTGNLTNGQLTNDATPTLTGTGEEGSTVRILDGNTVIGSVVVGEGGTWSFTPEPALTNGPHSLRVNAIDPAGNVSANSPVFTITVDITPPAAPAITSVVDDVGPATGTLASGASTNDNLPTFNGTGEVGATIQIFDNDALIGTAVVSAAGTWTFTPTTALTDGPHVFSLSAVDAAGNTSVTSTLYNLTVDTAAPNTPTLLSVTDDQGPNTGTLTSGQATNDQQPTLAGTAEAGAIVRILDNGVQIGETTAGSDGRWTFSPDSALSNGSHTLTITATDAAGNVSTPTQGFVVVVDNVPPQAPLISQAIDDQGSITGPVGSGQPTNDAQPVLNGTSEPNAVVRVFEGNTLIGQTQANADGSWSLPVETAFLDGQHVLTARAVDAAGNVSPPSPSFTLNIDTQPPATPVLTSVTDDVPAGTGPLTTGQTTNDNRPTLAGTAEAGSTVSIYDGTTLLGTVVATNGNWTFTPTTPLADGSHNLTVTATDAAGNSSTATGGFTIVVDATAPAVPVITTIVDDVGSITGPVTSATPTNDNRPTLNGTAEAGATVTIYDGTTVVGQAVADANGNWSLPQTNVALSEGQHNFTVTATDAAGNSSAASPITSIVVDTVAPLQPTSLAVVNNGTRVTGLAEAGSTVTITSANGTVLGTATANGDGTFTATISPAQTNGEALQVFATDRAGNAGTTSAVTAPFTTLPNAPVITTVTDGESPVTGTLTNGQATNDSTPTLAGTAQPNSTVTIYDNGVSIGTAQANGSGAWTFTPTTGLTEGSHAFTATASNATGTGPASTSTSVIVDTLAPNAPQGTFNADGSVLSGTAEAGSTVTINTPNGSFTTVANANGTFSYTFQQKQVDGEQITVTATDAAGNVSTTFPVTAPVLPLSASDNAIELELGTTATVTNTQYSDYGFLLVGAVGNVLTLLGNDTAQVDFTVGAGGSANMTIDANASGVVLSLLNTLELVVQRWDAVNNTWTTVVDTGLPQFANLLTLGASGVTLNLNDLTGGQYRVLSYNTNLLATGSYTSLNVNITETSAGTLTGETAQSGNVIDDVDPTTGSDTAPIGTLVTSITNALGQSVAVNGTGDTVVQGQYGTLTIRSDGTYTYALNSNAGPSVLGRTESFTYTLTGGGTTDSAKLVISLGQGTVSNGVVATDNTASLTFDTTVSAVDNGPSSQGGFTVVGINLGSTLGLNLLDDLSNPIIYNVEDGTTRTMTIQASVGGVALASTFDLYVYKFNEATQTFEQYRTVANWLRAPLLGGTSPQLTLQLPAGEYLFLLNTAAGITALTGYTLNVLQDHVYSVESVSATTQGDVLSDDIVPNGTVVSQVNGVAVSATGVTTIEGEYGTLRINAQGEYTYTLRSGVGSNGINTPDTFVYTVRTPTGVTDTASLNITPTARPLDAVNDVSQAVDVASVHHTAAYSDTTVGSASWTSALLGATQGSGSGTFVVDANTALHNVVLNFNVASLLNLGGLTVNWTLSQGGTTIRTGSFGGGILLGGNASINLTGLDLDAGTYTLSYTGRVGALSVGNITITPSVTGTSFSLSQFDSISGHTVNGNIFDGTDSQGAMDQLHSVDTRLSITGFNGVTSTIDPYESSSATVTVQGRYGTLSIAADGDYTYTLKSGVALSSITTKEVFNYTLTEGGKTDTASLTINMAPKFISSEHNDQITGTVYGDTLIYQVLNNTAGNATGGNSSGDHWTNFSLTQGDKIDIGDLLVGWNGQSSTLGNYIQVSTSGNNTVISIDRDGTGTAYAKSTLVTLDNVQTTYEELVSQNHIIT